MFITYKIGAHFIAVGSMVALWIRGWISTSPIQGPRLTLVLLDITTGLL